MKIIRLTTLLDFGGQERKYLSFTLHKEWLQHDYIFAAIGTGGYTSNELIRRGFSVKVLNLNFHLIHLKTLWEVYKWIKKEKPDVVHTAAVEANFYGVLAAKLAGVPVIIAEEIGIPKHSRKTQWLMRFIYRFTKTVICVSKAVHEYLVQIQEIPYSKGTVLYNPVDEKPRIKSSNSKKTIVSVGRLEKVKNQKLLLEVLPQLKDPTLHLILVGEGRERHILEQLIDSLKIQNRVTITGFVSNPEHYLAQANLFVLPSLSEGFGIAVLEAMQQGIPCLCTRVGGIPEFIEDNENGWLFNPTDKTELIHKINFFFDLPVDIQESMGERGRTSVLNRFSVEEYVTQLQNLYTRWQ
jgi:glycosyltransferase involved in cell wall biosynthesis